MHIPTARRSRTLLPLAALIAGAGAGCHKSTELEAGAVMLDVSVAAGVTTPDELRVSVFDDTGALWMDMRVPGSGALAPQSATLPNRQGANAQATGNAPTGRKK